MTPTTPTQNKTDLLSLTLPQLQAWLKERGEAPFRAKQIYNWLYRQLVADFSAMTNLSPSLRQRLADEAYIGPTIIRSELHSKDDRTRKILLELSDGKLVEFGANALSTSWRQQCTRHGLRLQPGRLCLWLYLLRYRPDGV